MTPNLRPWLRAAGAVMHKDLRIEARRGSMIGTWLILGVIAVVSALLVNGPINFDQAGDGLTLTWLMGALIGTTAVARAFRDERSLQGWTATMATPSPPGALFLGKTAAQIVVTMLALTTAVLAYVLIVEWPADVLQLLVVAFFGATGICGIATLIVSARPRDRRGAIVPVLLALPLAAPVVYLAAEATQHAVDATDSSWSPLLTWLGGYSLLIVLVGAIGFELVANTDGPRPASR